MAAYRAREVVRAATISGAHLSGRFTRNFYVALEYPPSAANAPRYGYGRPVHPRLAATLAQHSDRYERELAAIERYEAEFFAIDRRPSDDGMEPYWEQIWLPGLDAMTLYGFLRSRQPPSYVEIGSGFSTMFAARAIRDGALPTRITSIDPAPRSEIDALCNTVIRKPLEHVDLAVFGDLEPGDVVFMDGSHRTFMNSDATVFFLDVLPHLREGVLVGVHDVFLPLDYPPEWAEWYYSEQYLLAAYLLAESPRIAPVLPCCYVLSQEDRSPPLARLVENPRFAPAEAPWFANVPPGVAFWLETTGSRPVH